MTTIKHQRVFLFLWLVLAATSRAQGPDQKQEALKEGVYALEGSNSEKGQVYRGKVIIQKEGTNYRLTWIIANHQTQAGVGILEGSVLSVSYLDSSFKELGVVSYRLSGEGALQGKWAALGTSTAGWESLRFVSERTESSTPPTSGSSVKDPELTPM